MTSILWERVLTTRWGILCASICVSLSYSGLIIDTVFQCGVTTKYSDTLPFFQKTHRMGNWRCALARVARTHGFYRRASKKKLSH
jgi:hypothetical protein